MCEYLDLCKFVIFFQKAVLQKWENINNIEIWNPMRGTVVKSKILC